MSHREQATKPSVGHFSYWYRIDESPETKRNMNKAESRRGYLSSTLLACRARGMTPHRTGDLQKTQIS